MKELVLKKCLKCGALIEIIEDCTCDNCGIKCCSEQMQTVVPNKSEASFEKHLPQYNITDKEIIVTVNHIMEEDHFIEWIGMACNKKIGKKFLKPNEQAVVVFPYVPGSKIYSYCNKHGLWCTEVK